MSVFYTFSFAQNTDVGGSKKGFYVDSTKKYYHKANLPVYINVSPNPNDVGVPLSGKVVGQQKKTRVQPMYLDGHGVHVIKHKGRNGTPTFEYVINADGLAPTSKSKFITPYRYAEGKTRYYGRDLEIKLRTQDQMSGVEGLFSSLDDEEFAPYEESFGVEDEGEHVLKYYAIDNVGNQEKTKIERFVVDVTPPVSTYNVVGIAKENIVSTSTKIYLTIEDNIVGVSGTRYRFDDEAWQPYSGQKILPISKLRDGKHTLQFYSTDFLSNREKTQRFDFYLDKTAPIMSADVLGDRFIVANQVYFSGRTKLKLTAVDNKAGIKQVWYSIDGGAWKRYDQPFYLPSKSGLHTIRYYAEDEMGNAGVEGVTDARYDEYKHNVGSVYVDLTGPKLGYQYEGSTFRKGAQVYISPRTNVRLMAKDGESGLQRISYKQEDENDEADYSKPFRVTEAGEKTLEIIGYDNVNNRNVIKTNFVVDTQAPEIFHHFSTASIDSTAEGVAVYPSYTKVFLASQDNETDCGTIYYSINGSPKMPYTGSIAGFKKNTRYKITVEVADKLGNVAKRRISFVTSY